MHPRPLCRPLLETSAQSQLIKPCLLRHLHCNVVSVVESAIPQPSDFVRLFSPAVWWYFCSPWFSYRITQQPKQFPRDFLDVVPGIGMCFVYLLCFVAFVCVCVCFPSESEAPPKRHMFPPERVVFLSCDPASESLSPDRGSRRRS